MHSQDFVSSLPDPPLCLPVVPLPLWGMPPVSQCARCPSSRAKCSSCLRTAGRRQAERKRDERGSAITINTGSRQAVISEFIATACIVGTCMGMRRLTIREFHQLRDAFFGIWSGTFFRIHFVHSDDLGSAFFGLVSMRTDAPPGAGSDCVILHPSHFFFFAACTLCLLNICLV